MMSTTNCPNCGAARIHRSRRRTAFEQAAAAIGGGMRRCHRCNSRFLEIGGSLIRLRDAQRVARKMMLGLAMAAAVGVLLVMILWLSHAQSMPPAFFLSA